MCNLDAGRMKYVWTEESEWLYQIVQKVDDLEWRLYTGGCVDTDKVYCGPTYYLTYIDGKPTRFDRSISYFGGVTGHVYGDLIKKLQEKNAEVPCLRLTTEQHNLFEMCSSWQELDSKAGQENGTSEQEETK